MGKLISSVEGRLHFDSVRSEVRRTDGDPEVLEAGDLLVSYLTEMGVEAVFGVPGGNIEPLFNALLRSARVGGPKPIVARHETGAAFMAEGYARYSGKMGVCCSTTGPGATNLITGVCSAFESNIPLLVITAQTAMNRFGRKAMQESSDTGINTIGMFEFCTGYNSLVSHADQLEYKLISAIMTAMNNSCPVHLSVPLDILRNPLIDKSPSYDVAALAQAPRLQDIPAIEELCRQLKAAKNIVLILGAGCSEAVTLISQVAFRLRAKIVTTPDGKGLVNPRHPLFHGVIGFAGHRCAEEALLDPLVDTVVAVGTSLGEWSSNGWDERTILNSRLIHIEPLQSNLTRSPMARLHVRGRVLPIFEALAASLDNPHAQLDPDAIAQELIESGVVNFAGRGQLPPLNGGREESWGASEENGRVKPRWLMTQLTSQLPRNTKYLADAGNSMAWAIHYLHPFDRRVLERRHCSRTKNWRERSDNGRRNTAAGLFQAPIEFASMGWAIGASIGAALACPKQPIVCITGDGSMLMSGQEITVALQHKLSIIYIVLNDSSLGMVKHGQRMVGAEQGGYELPAVDFKGMASAMGVNAYRVTCPNDLVQLPFDELCRHAGPTLLDVLIDPDEEPPIGLRVKVLSDR